MFKYGGFFGSKMHTENLQRKVIAIILATNILYGFNASFAIFLKYAHVILKFQYIV